MHRVPLRARAPLPGHHRPRVPQQGCSKSCRPLLLRAMQHRQVLCAPGRSTLQDTPRAMHSAQCTAARAAVAHSTQCTVHGACSPRTSNLPPEPRRGGARHASDSDMPARCAAASSSSGKMRWASRATHDPTAAAASPISHRHHATHVPPARDRPVQCSLTPPSPPPLPKSGQSVSRPWAFWRVVPPPHRRASRTGTLPATCVIPGKGANLTPLPPPSAARARARVREPGRTWDATPRPLSVLARGL
ncbi:hypothetical protein BC628DRAFT_440916 [Trametes gibbosa]|nr:hypothetical protein BC628DRAFT_440916 [Trametes gibbosa]